jgi:mono/diheme cytochrome c family protein
MRVPPAGTVPRERSLLAIEAPTGRQGPFLDAGYLEQNPLPLTRALLERGRKRFEITCATCHGLLGDGNSMVARNMALRPPPSLHQYREQPDGYFFEVITNGYGLMPAYDSSLGVEERWAVVAYLRALTLSQDARLEDAQGPVRKRLLQERGP